MPAYEYICPDSHITTRIAPISQWKDRIRCKCGRMAEQFFTKPPHPHSGRTIWTATEVLGAKRAASEEYAADLEEAAMGGRELQ